MIVYRQPEWIRTTAKAFAERRQPLGDGLSRYGIVLTNTNYSVLWQVLRHLDAKWGARDDRSPKSIDQNTNSKSLPGFLITIYNRLNFVVNP